MKERPVLYSIIILSLILELFFIFSLLLTVGPERLLIQSIRVIVQLLFIFPIILNKSKWALYCLTAYHGITSALIYAKGLNDEWFAIALCLFHIVAALLILFHEEIEKKVFGITEKSKEEVTDSR